MLVENTIIMGCLGWAARWKKTPIFVKEKRHLRIAEGTSILKACLYHRQRSSPHLLQLSLEFETGWSEKARLGSVSSGAVPIMGLPCLYVDLSALI